MEIAGFRVLPLLADAQAEVEFEFRGFVPGLFERPPARVAWEPLC